VIFNKLKNIVHLVGFTIEIHPVYFTIEIHPVYFTFSKQPILFLSLPLCGALGSMFTYYFNHRFLFQINAHNMLNTHIYNKLLHTCFGVCYATVMDTIALLAQKHAYNMHCLFLNLECCYNV